MRNPLFRLLLGLFFAIDGMLFAMRAIWRGDDFYIAISAIWLIAAAFILASWWIERRQAKKS